MIKSFLKVLFRIVSIVCGIGLIWVDETGIAIKLLLSIIFILVILLYHENRVLSTKLEFYKNFNRMPKKVGDYLKEYNPEEDNGRSTVIGEVNYTDAEVRVAAEKAKKQVKVFRGKEYPAGTPIQAIMPKQEYLDRKEMERMSSLEQKGQLSAGSEDYKNFQVLKKQYGNKDFEVDKQWSFKTKEKKDGKDN